MKGARELNAMKDTPGFRNKKVLALTKLRHSSIAGPKPPASTSAGKKDSKVKRKQPAKEKLAQATKDIGLKKTKRGPKPKVEASTSASTSEKESKGEQKGTQHEQSFQSSSKKETKSVKSSTSRPNRNLRSQIGEMLMRHGKKIVKLPKPRRKRTLSGEFDLLDEICLKRQLKETNEVSRDAESADEASKRQKRESKNKTGPQTKPNIPILTADNICVSHELKSKSKKDSASTDAVTSQEEISVLPSTTGSQRKKLTGEDAEQTHRKRGRPPKKKRLFSGVSFDATDSEVLHKKSRVEAEDTKKAGMRSDKVYHASKHRNEEVNLRDPYSFCGLDFEEEDDQEISFKPVGISGEVKRKPGRPKDDKSRQPPIRSLSVKSTHRLLISDKKSKRFGRPQGKKMAVRTSQLYRSSIRRGKRLALKDIISSPSLGSKEATVIDEEKKGQKPTILTLTEDDTSEQTSNIPASPDFEHPILPPINSICSPSSSNEELEPPVLELVNSYNVVLESIDADRGIADEDAAQPIVDEEGTTDEVHSNIDEMCDETVDQVCDATVDDVNDTADTCPQEEILKVNIIDQNEDEKKSELIGVPEVSDKEIEKETCLNALPGSSDKIDIVTTEASVIEEPDVVNTNEANDSISDSDQNFSRDVEVTDKSCPPEPSSLPCVVESATPSELTSDELEGSSNDCVKAVSSGDGDTNPMSNGDGDKNPMSSGGGDTKLMASGDIDREPMSSLTGDTKPVSSGDLDMKPIASGDGDREPMSSCKGDTKPVSSSNGDMVQMASGEGDAKLVSSSDGDAEPISSGAGDMKPVPSKQETSDDIAADMVIPVEGGIESQNLDIDGQSELAKEKDNGGIKLKLRRHKGTFKVTTFSRDGTVGDTYASACLTSEAASEVDIVLIMNSILDQVEGIVDGTEVKEMINITEMTERSHDSKCIEVQSTSGKVVEPSKSEPSSPESEKRVPPLTIRLKAAKASSSQEDRKFGLRPKVSRSPIEIIALRQKHIDEEYEKNEAARLAKKMEKKFSKKRLCTDTALPTVPKSEKGTKTTIDLLMERCSPCSVNIVDFVKQLNLMNQPKADSDASVLTDSVDVDESLSPENSHCCELQLPAPAIVKRKRMMKVQSRAQAGKPRIRTPKHTEEVVKDGPVTMLPIHAKVPPEKKAVVEKDVDKLDGKGFVGSFVEFLKSKKSEKPMTLASVPSQEQNICYDQSKTVSPTAVSGDVKVNPVPESSKSKVPQKSGTKYLCNKCEFSSLVKKTMEFHVYSHILGLTFKCGYCDKQFGSMIGASTHSKNEHMGKESKIIKSKALIESELYHVLEPEPKVESTEKDGSVDCTSPGQVIISFLVGRNLSLKPSFTAKRFVCTHCEYSTDILEDVQQHCEDLHKLDQMFSCILCADAYFKSEDVVMSHGQNTHPSRPQSYRQLPQFYDIEQIKAAEKSHEDRGNIFDRMNNLFTASNMCDEANPRMSHYQRAKDFLHLQEGWKSKTSAEADSTTSIDSEHAAAAGVDTHNKTLPTNFTQESPLAVQPNDKEESLQHKQTVPDRSNDTATAVSGDVQEKMKKDANDAPSSPIKPSVTVAGHSGQALPISHVHAPEQPEAVEHEIALTCLDKPSAEPTPEMNCDESNESGLKIIDVVSLRDQSVDSAYKTSLVTAPVAAKVTTPKKASSPREADLEALALRNEKIKCTYKCMKCNIHSPYLSAMVEHLKHYHCEIPLFTCPYCKGIASQKPDFTTEFSVHEHVKKAHPSNCAKNEVSLSDKAKTLVQVLAIPSGVDSNKSGNTFVIEKDIYMCLKCQAHMPSLDYTFSHLEKEHIDVFVNVCPICKTFKDKSEEVVCLHIIKDHKQDPSLHPLSVAIEDSLFVRVPSISKSGAYNDRLTSHKKAVSKPNATVTSQQSGIDSDNDVMVIGQTYIQKSMKDRLSTMKQTISTTPQSKVSVNPHHLLLCSKELATSGASSKSQVDAAMKQTSDHQSRQLLMDCESVDDSLSTVPDLVEGDKSVPRIPVVPSANNVGCIATSIDASTVISLSAAMAVASSIVSTSTSVKMPCPPEQVSASLPLTTPPPPLKKFGMNTPTNQGEGGMSGTHGKEDLSPSSSSHLMTKSVESGKQQICQAIKEIQTRPKSSLSSMTNTIHKLQLIAVEKEKARLSKDKSSPVGIVENISSVATVTRPVLKIPIYTSSASKLSQQQLSQGTPVTKEQNRPQTTPIQHRSLLFRNTPLDLSRTPSPAKTPLSGVREPTLVNTAPQLLPRETLTASAPPVRVSTDELPPDAFKIFNLKPDVHRNVKSTSAVQSVSSSPQPVISNTINVLGNLANPGTVIQQGQPLPFTQVVPVQIAGVPMTPIQLQGLCMPGVNSANFIVANFQQHQQHQQQQQQQQQDKRTSVIQQRAGLARIMARTPESHPVPHNIPSTGKTVAQALAERARQQQNPQQHQQQQQQLHQQAQHSKQHHLHHLTQQRLRMKQSTRIQPPQPMYYCPYCPEYRPLPDFQVTPHIQRCHPGKEVIFIKHSS